LPSAGNVNSRSPRGGGQVGDADAMMVVMSEPAQPRGRREARSCLGQRRDPAPILCTPGGWRSA
jgi:hypothetical protein